MKRFVLFIAVLVLSSITFAQTTQIEKIKSLLKDAKEDTNKVKYLYKLCHEYRIVNDYYNGLSYGEQALQLAKELNFKKGIAVSYTNIGNVYFYKGNYSDALRNNLEALKINKDMNDKIAISDSYNNIGTIYLYADIYLNALHNHISALKIEKEIINEMRNKPQIDTGIIYDR